MPKLSLVILRSLEGDDIEQIDVREDRKFRGDLIKMIPEYEELRKYFAFARARADSFPALGDYDKLKMQVLDCEACIKIIKDCIKLIDKFHKEYAPAIWTLIYSGDQVHEPTSNNLSAAFRKKLQPLQAEFEVIRGRIMEAYVPVCNRAGETQRIKTFLGSQETDHLIVTSHYGNPYRAPACSHFPQPRPYHRRQTHRSVPSGG
jgi:hypothetical protein